MIDPGLSGKVVLVTGANNPYGVGAATARAFARQGASVFLTYFRPVPRLAPVSVEPEAPGDAFYRRQQAAPIEPVVESIRNEGGRAEAYAADLGDVRMIPSLLDRAEEAFGGVDVLVNNAAYCEPDTLFPSQQVEEPGHAPTSWMGGSRSFDSEAFDRHFAVNTRAVALLINEFARRHVARSANWGRVINVSTDGAWNFPREVSYGASKYAMESFSRSAAVELGPLGITVNVVSLGMVQTGWVTGEMEQRTAAAYPLRRIGQPDDVSDVIVFLASQQARWITGQVVYVGGGHEMSR